VQRKWYYSSHVNKVYFNPSVTYTPPKNADGTRKSHSLYDDAWTDGYLSSTKRNLSNNFVMGNIKFDSGGFYYRFDSSVAGCEADPKQNKCYQYVSVNSESAEVKQNFANWYSYYRTRLMAAKAGIGEAFSELPAQFRLGWGAINNSDRTIDDTGDKIYGVSQGVRSYGTTHRNDFYTWLYGKSVDGILLTPLMRALNGAGEYYEKSQRAWTDNPGQSYNASTNPERQCRQAYPILMTDGYYSDSLDTQERVGRNTVTVRHKSYQADDEAGIAITNASGASYQYQPTYPFKDEHTDKTTLADVAMYYWKRDIRPNLPNYVPTTNKDPAFWQHMVTYGVGLGVSGSVTPTTAFDAITSKTQINWWGSTDDQNKLNDLLHAAVNSRGGFFSAADPSEFGRELSEMLVDIAAEAGSATGVEFNVASFQEG